MGQDREAPLREKLIFEGVYKSVIGPEYFVFLCYERPGRLIFPSLTSRLQSAGFVLRRCHLQPPLPHSPPPATLKFLPLSLDLLLLHCQNWPLISRLMRHSAVFFQLTDCYSFTGLTSSSFKKNPTT